MAQSSHAASTASRYSGTVNAGGLPPRSGMRKVPTILSPRSIWPTQNELLAHALRRRIKLFALGLERALQSAHRNVDPAVIRRVLAQRKLSVLLHAGFRNLLGVLVRNAVVALLISG